MELYKYRAKVTNVVDGDTVDVMVDLGFKIWVKKRVRLYGINTPEVRGDEKVEGFKSKERVKTLIDGKDIYLVSMTDKDKYGRCIAKILLFEDERDLTTILISEGLGVQYYGNT